MNPRARKALLRLAMLFAAIPIAFAVGWSTGSPAAFVAVLAVGLVVSVVLRLTATR